MQNVVSMARFKQKRFASRPTRKGERGFEERLLSDSCRIHIGSVFNH